MYFPIGWPKVLKIPELGGSSIKQVTCNREKVLFAILTYDTISIWFCKPCVPIVFHRRDSHSIAKFGSNVFLEWKPDSSMFVIVTSEGHLLFYNVQVLADQKGLYVQTDSPHESLKRDSAELFIKEIIPPLHLSLKEEIQVWDGEITGIVCTTMTEFMISTKKAHVLRYRWDGTQNRDYTLDLRRIPFCINQQVSKALPIVEENVYISCMEYSPLVGGFAISLNDGRAAFLTASSLKFDPNQAQGIWAQGIEDATYASVNHKYRLIAFGRANSECVVYCVDESTGGLEVSHQCVLSSKDYPGCPGAVSQIKWTPDGCAMAVAWDRGGLTLWSTFGALLMCSLGWDYGLHVDLEKENPLHITSMEFATEGYELWMVRKLCYEKEKSNDSNGNEDENKVHAYSVVHLDFVKSALTTNPCMSHNSHLYLQGDDKLYVNTVDTLRKFFSDRSDGNFGENNSSMLTEGRQWLIIPIPSTYSATNWPIRYSAIDHDGQNIAVAGRTGLAHYCIATRRWKLFGNETQEKDFIITGGLLWWKDYIVLGCYSIIDNRDEIRFYPKECKLDNRFAKIVRVSAPILLINGLYDQLITFGSDAEVSIWSVNRLDLAGNVEISKIQAIDISALCVHPACVTSVTLTCIRTESSRHQNTNSENIVLNVSGRLLLVQRKSQNGDRYTCSMPTVLASCVENVWVPLRRKVEKVHLTEALWLFCGSHGMRVWLPLFPKDGDKTHTFMSKRIMLPFNLRIYPLAILFEDAIILGGENDTTLYTSDSNSPFSLPFNFLGRTSQVYLHQILRQLIRRNLGFHAWEIARSCNNLPYFPHSLELLLHEVLEEEATSKEPIPDAQLPSVIEFIMEFPVYLQTVVQCARKTEIALWPYLFSAAGKPKDLFQECMVKKQLDTAASYLIILQNLETSSVSRQYATLLLDTALEQSKWELARELVRFLRAIDPNDVESPRTSFILPSKLGFSQTPPVSPNAEDLSLILGNVQGSRCRSFSTTVTPKFPENKLPIGTNSNNPSAESPLLKSRKSTSSTVNIKNESRDGTAEEFFIDVILQRHARRLLSSHRLSDLGYFAAHLDFHLVTWLAREKDRAARIDDFVIALKSLHQDFNWPYPTVTNAPRTSISSVQSLLDSPAAQLDDRIKALHIDTTNINQTSSRIGDSGYMSFPGGLPCTGLLTSMNNVENYSQVSESEMDQQSEMTQVEIEESPPDSIVNSKREESRMSMTSSVWGFENETTNAISENWDVPQQVLEQLSNCGTKGSQRAEVQLRYLLQLFLEASCLEWSLIISILLRDAMAVIRTVNSARTSDQTIEALSRLKQGLQVLFNWTNRECLGYKSFMMAIHSQISVLSKILTTKIQQQQIQEHQQAVSATFSKITTFVPPKGRKVSTGADSNSQTGSRELVSSQKGSLGSSEKPDSQNTPSSQNESEDYSPPSSIIPESTGCVVS